MPFEKQHQNHRRLPPRIGQMDFVSVQRAQTSRKLNALQNALEKKGEICEKEDLLSTLSRQYKPLKKRKLGRHYLTAENFRKYKELESKIELLVKRLNFLGVPKEEIDAVIKKPSRKSRLLLFKLGIKGTVEALADTPARKEKLEEIRREVKDWNFVNPADEADVNFHALVEIKRWQLEGRW